MSSFCAKLKVVYEFEYHGIIAKDKIKADFFLNHNSGNELQTRKQKIIDTIAESLIRKQSARAGSQPDTRRVQHHNHKLLAYTMNMVHVMQEVKRTTSSYQQCLYNSLLKFGVTFDILDAWHSNEAETTASPTHQPTQSPVSKGQHVVAYGKISGFHEFDDFANKRNVLERRLSRLLTDLIPYKDTNAKKRPVMHFWTPIIQPIALEIQFPASTKREQLVPMSSSWERVIKVDEQGERIFQNVSIGPVYHDTITIKLYKDDVYNIKWHSEKTVYFFESVFKGRKHVNKSHKTEPLYDTEQILAAKTTLELCVNERIASIETSIKVPFNDMMKPTFVLKMSKPQDVSIATETNEDMVEILDYLKVEFVLSPMYADMIAAPNFKYGLLIQDYIQRCFQDYIFSQGTKPHSFVESKFSQPPSQAPSQAPTAAPINQGESQAAMVQTDLSATCTAVNETNKVGLRLNLKMKPKSGYGLSMMNSQIMDDLETAIQENVKKWWTHLPFGVNPKKEDDPQNNVEDTTPHCPHLSSNFLFKSNNEQNIFFDRLKPQTLFVFHQLESLKISHPCQFLTLRFDFEDETNDDKLVSSIAMEGLMDGDKFLLTNYDQKSMFPWEGFMVENLRHTSFPNTDFHNLLQKDIAFHSKDSKVGIMSVFASKQCTLSIVGKTQSFRNHTKSIIIDNLLQFRNTLVFNIIGPLTTQTRTKVPEIVIGTLLLKFF